MESFITNWNGDFPNYPLTAVDLELPHKLMGALFQVFDRLGIDIDVILAVSRYSCLFILPYYLKVTLSVYHIFTAKLLHRF